MSGGGQPVVSGRRGGNKNKNQSGGSGGGGANEDAADELSKEEKQMARYLRLSCPKKQGNLLGMKVDFFVAQKLVDCLMESKWGPKSAAPVLANRNACVALMQRFMNKQLFYRALKIYKETTTTNADDSKEKGGDAETTPSPKKSKKKPSSQTPTATPKAATETSTTPSGSNTDAQQQQQQQKRKFKLEMHEEQKFLDANEPYVWVYDPTSTKTYIIGSLLILGAIGICLFPLWPSQVREGVYYLSLAGASFLGAILGLAVLKYIVFGLVWAVTLGSVHFWLLPNLTEDVGFFESFVPVYKYSIPKRDETAAIQDSAAKKKKDDDAAPATTTTTSDTKPDEATTTTTTTTTTTKRLEQSTLSGSTVEISSADVAMDKSTVVRRRKSANARDDEDDFELVDGDANDDAPK